MKIDLTKRIKTLQGNFAISPNIDKDELRAEVDLKDGANISANDIPEKFHFTYGDAIEIALSNFTPDNKKQALFANALAGKVLGEDEVELNKDMVSTLKSVLENTTKTKESEDAPLVYWITSPIINELEE